MESNSSIIQDDYCKCNVCPHCGKIRRRQIPYIPPYSPYKPPFGVRIQEGRTW